MEGGGVSKKITEGKMLMDTKESREGKNFLSILWSTEKHWKMARKTARLVSWLSWVVTDPLQMCIFMKPFEPYHNLPLILPLAAICSSDCSCRVACFNEVWLYPSRLVSLYYECMAALWCLARYLNFKLRQSSTLLTSGYSYLLFRLKNDSYFSVGRKVWFENQ